MFSSNHSRFSSKSKHGKKSNRGLSIATSEDSGCELIIRPSSSGSSESRANSKVSESSRGSSFRNRFRRGGSKKNKNESLKREKGHPPNKPPSRTAAVSNGKISPPAELRLKLLPRIADYRERGWINTTEEANLMKTLSDQPVDFETTVDHAALHVEKALDVIRDKKEKHQKDHESRDETSQSNDSQARTTSLDAIQSIQHGEACIAYPSEVWDAKEIESKEKLKEMFVAMCFFARLGFIQPPSCLRCAHRESMHDKPRDDTCKQWVAWRKNAKTQLHPDELEGNVIMVQCHAARSLVGGKEIQGYKWDAQEKLLRYAPSSESA